MPRHMTAIQACSRPKLAGKVRLRFDRLEQRFLLLYPERGLLLNEAASEILQLCTGKLAIDTIVAVLSSRHASSSRDAITNHVLCFLSELQLRGLIEG
jgi:pyrroloquinoline quinone biosynthesis protein D